MKENLNTLKCGRENDLIAFLYREQSPDEKETFSRHLHDCAACSSQFATFTNIRESVVAWRNESIGGTTSAFSHSDVTRVERERPSARAAIREFLNLSPLWMKGAGAFASLLFCLFAVLAAAHLRDAPPAAVVTSPNNGAEGAERQFNALVERRVQEELQRQRASSTSNGLLTVQSPSVPDTRAANRVKRLASPDPSRNPRRPLTKVEREELAADMRLTAGTNESELELLDDRINQ
jgi:anti-sigma factor RsiW